MRIRAAVPPLCAAIWFVGAAADLHSQPLPAKVRVTVMSVDGSTSDVREDLRRRQLVGTYQVGDGLGYNLNLALKEDGKFECRWVGCLGVYGTSSGTWTIQDAGLTLNAAQADGMLKERPVDQLRVFSLQNNYLLLQERDADWFKKHGADTYCCFHQTGARTALEGQQRRRVEKATKDSDQKPKN